MLGPLSLALHFSGGSVARSSSLGLQNANLSHVGCLMVRFKGIPFASILVLVVFSLTSCTLKRPCPLCGSGGGGGNKALLSVTLAAIPPAPPPGTNILSFAVTIIGVSITPSTGSALSLTLPAASLTYDLAKLQSDSAFIVLASVPAATYNTVTVDVSSVVVTYCTQTSPGTQGCSTGTVAQVTQTTSTPATSSFSITLAGNQQAGMQIQFNLANAITISSTNPQVVSAVNLNAANVLTASVLAPTSTTSSLATGQLDFVEDVTGLVTSATASTQTVTIQTATHGSITATANSSTFFSPNCVGFGLQQNFSSCVQANQIASIDLALNGNGTSTLLDYDPLDTSATDWIEGVVTLVPTSLTQFQIVANDLFQPTTGSLVGTNLPLGSTVTVNLGAGATFGVDDRGYTVPADAGTFSSSNDTSVLRAGQTVAVRVSSFTAAVGSTPASVTVNFVGLRFTRVTASVSSVAAPTSISLGSPSLPPFFGQINTEFAELNTASAPSREPTNYDGVGDATQLTVGNTVSIRALYFGSGSAIPFTCAKIRKH
jgi:hypothetical protein